MADLSQLDSKVEPLNEDFEGNSMNISGVPLSPLFPQDHSFLQQIMTSQEVKDMLANFKSEFGISRWLGLPYNRILDLKSSKIRFKVFFSSEPRKA